MSTGYTYFLINGEEKSFYEFALTCARAFGACVTLRDEPMGIEIPEFKPSKYHIEHLEKAQEELKKLRDMTQEEIQKAVDDDFEKTKESIKKRNEETKEIARRYKTMLSKIEGWVPPTSEHEGIKKFMLKQVKDSLSFDVSYENEEIEKMTLDEWYENRIKHILWNIDYHTKGYEEEIKRCNNANKWIKELKDSVIEYESKS